MTPRQKALELGEELYYTGKPCVNGHVAMRRTTNAACQECVANARKDIAERMKQSRLIRNAA